jgi:site-specific recombinase XerD
MEKHIPFEEVANKLMCRLEEKGYSDSYIKFSYEIDLHKLKAYLVKTSSMIYTKKLGTEFIAITSMESVCQNRKNSYKRTIRHLNEILDEEEFRPISSSSHSLRVFNYVLLRFEDDLRKKGLRERTILDRKSGAFYFLNYLESCGITELAKIRPEIIYRAYNETNGKRLFSAVIPILLRFVYRVELTKSDHSRIVPRTVIPQTMPSVYSEDEIIIVRNCINRDTDVGKRDYAIFLLQARYGIRSCDIVRLGFDNVDFQRGRISFIQSKTSVRISFPMEGIVSEALQIYIDKARPTVSSGPLFLRTKAPYTSLTRSGCSAIANRYFRESGVEFHGRRHGGHALRSSLASNLINSDIAYTSVQNILGHSDINTVQEYAKIDLERLRICALEVPAPTGALKAFLEQKESVET